MIEIKVPTVGESISEVSLAKWLKKDGQWVERDEVLAEIESEKATFEINAEQAGILTIKVQEGDTLAIGDIVCSIDEKAERPADLPVEAKEEKTAKAATPEAAPASKSDLKASPVAAAIIADKKVDAKGIAATGTGGKILKQDVLEAISNCARPFHAVWLKRKILRPCSPPSMKLT
jgi:2-oxoglutarate dehydrogenase E2 component (dihydrolipoamide succinyltransferase)